MAAVWIRVFFAGVTARKATITASMETDPAIEEEAGVSPPSCTDKIETCIHSVFYTEFIYIRCIYTHVSQMKMEGWRRALRLHLMGLVGGLVSQESTPVKKTSVLVLGATGTIGRQVVRQLLKLGRHLLQGPKFQDASGYHRPQMFLFSCHVVSMQDIAR